MLGGVQGLGNQPAIEGQVASLGCGVLLCDSHPEWECQPGKEELATVQGAGPPLAWNTAWGVTPPGACLPSIWPHLDTGPRMLSMSSRHGPGHRGPTAQCG